jgi:hypothetical protein
MDHGHAHATERFTATTTDSDLGANKTGSTVELTRNAKKLRTDRDRTTSH